MNAVAYKKAESAPGFPVTHVWRLAMAKKPAFGPDLSVVDVTASGARPSKLGRRHLFYPSSLT